MSLVTGTVVSQPNPSHGIPQCCPAELLPRLIVTTFQTTAASLRILGEELTKHCWIYAQMIVVALRNREMVSAAETL